MAKPGSGATSSRPGQAAEALLAPGQKGSMSQQALLPLVLPRGVR